MRFFEIFNKQYLKRTMITLVTGLVAMGLVFYISYHLTSTFEEPLGLMNAIKVNQSRTIHGDGYILRSEEVLYASTMASGSVTPAVGDGVRLARYDRAADIYEGTSPDVLARMEEIDSQLTLLEKSQTDTLSRHNTSGLDAAIFQNVQDIRTLVAQDAIGEAVTMKTAFLMNLKRRELAGGNGADVNTQIGSLRDEKNALKASLGACLETCYTPRSGYYFSPASVDGYEEIFVAEDLTDMTYEAFMALTTAEPKESGRSGQCIGKIITDFRWYLACPMSKTDAALLEDGFRYTVTFPFNGNKTLDLRLETVIPELPGTGAVAVFVCDTMPDGFDYTRMQPVQVAVAEYEGFSIPTSAVRMLDGYEGVYVLDEVTVIFRRIQIVYEEDGRYICMAGEEDKDCPYDWLRLNDVIITEGTGLEVGKVIG